MERRTYKKSSRTGVFFLGFFVGVLVSAAVAVGLAGYLIRHPQAVIEKAADIAVDRVVERTVQTVPKAYIGQNQEVIASSARQFADAFSQNRITPTEMNLLAKKMLATIADQKITQAEIDDILQLMNRYSM